MKYLIVAVLGALFALTIFSVATGGMDSGADIALLSLMGSGICVGVFTLFLGEYIFRDMGDTSGSLAIMILYVLAMLLVAIGGTLVVFLTSALQPTLWWSGGSMVVLSFWYLFIRKN